MGIEIRRLCFSYGGYGVLHELNLCADHGEMVALLGPNGAGKSTLMRCILGLLKDYTGEIFLDGENIRRQSRPALAKKVAYIPQSAPVVFHYTVLDTVLMGATGELGVLGAPRRSHVERAQDILAQLGAAHLAQRSVGELSGGERQLVLLARALLQNARTLIMDEPTANLDYGNQNRVMERVAALSRAGYLIFFSTHDPNQALLYASRAVTLLSGRVLSDGPPRDTLTEYVLETLYHIPVSRCTVVRGAEEAEVCVPRRGG